MGEEKLELLGKWYEEYWPEVCAILSVGIPSAIVGGIILVNEANKSGDALNAQRAPDPVGDVQHSPGAPLVPKYTYVGSRPVETFCQRDPNGETIYRF
ncbi:MAG TPA: hypothetical protein VMW36_07665 [Patescibacteria group bacterium]|nr:hypothetical protein [Patescibacteria group bacterium]